MNTYTCECCGKVLDDWPSLTFDTPATYYWLNEKDKANSSIDNDFCVVNTEGKTFYFIRVVMFQKVIDSCQELHYGLWVSLSEDSFKDYQESFKTENYREGYFGWLNSDIPEYEGCNEVSIPMNVYTQKNSLRPYVVPHKDSNHPLVTDFYRGITMEEAEGRIQQMLSQ